MNDPLEILRYPLGRFTHRTDIAQEETQRNIDRIAALPEKLRKLVGSYSEERLSTPYRPGGWTVRQVVHHLADSHINSYVRFKLALTEENPTIRPYDEAAWAELDDGRMLDVQVSLSLLEFLHRRWVSVLRAMKPEDFRRTFFHPEHNQVFVLDDIVAMYAWHSEHHYEQIHQLALHQHWQ